MKIVMKPSRKLLKSDHFVHLTYKMYAESANCGGKELEKPHACVILYCYVSSLFVCIYIVLI